MINRRFMLITRLESRTHLKIMEGLHFECQPCKGAGYLNSRLYFRFLLRARYAI
jgi:hypothetical protein